MAFWERVSQGIKLSHLVVVLLSFVVALVLGFTNYVAVQIEKHEARPHEATAAEFVRKESFAALQEDVAEIKQSLHELRQEMGQVREIMTEIRVSLATKGHENTQKR